MIDITDLNLWEECTECGGSGEDREWFDSSDPGYKPRCRYCNGTGKVPIRYTPESARASGYEVRDDDPVWEPRVLKSGKRIWLITTMKQVRGWFEEGIDTEEEIMSFCHKLPIVLAERGQGKPDPDWRPE